jgi:transcriptional regulator with XRE-family HTH domain
MTANEHNLFLKEFIKFGIAPEPRRVTRLREWEAAEMKSMEADLHALPVDSHRNPVAGECRKAINKAIADHPGRCSRAITKALTSVSSYRDWAPTPADWVKLYIASQSSMGRPGFKFDRPAADPWAERAFYLDTMLSNVERVEREEAYAAEEGGPPPRARTTILKDAIERTEDAITKGDFDTREQDQSKFKFKNWGQDGLAVKMSPVNRARPRAHRLLDLRTSRNLTQEQLALRLAVDVEKIQKWEAHGPDYKYLQGLADALGCSPQFIWGDVEFPPSLRGFLDAQEHYRSLIEAAFRMSDWSGTEVRSDHDAIDEHLDSFLPYELRTSTIVGNRTKREQEREAKIQAEKNLMEILGKDFHHPQPGAWKDPE